MAPVTLLIVGCGERGAGYARYALEHPDLARVVGVAEPRAHHRETTARTHALDPTDAACVFDGWEAAAAVPRLADAVVIATLDQMHREPAEKFAALGYHILLEKPMAVTEDDCRAICAAVEARPGMVFAVGHVLRYSPYSTQVRRIIESGALGEVISAQHLEPVGYYHFAHSYVRGNWARMENTSFVLMAKSCHDMDWLPWALGKRVARVSSFGALTHFRPGKGPEGHTDRCVTCPAEQSCPYSAKKVYLERAEHGDFGWPTRVVTPEQNVDAVRRALETGPYGRCVYAADNDQPDHQVVSMQFEDGATATFSMVATTELLCERQTKIFGSRGELSGDMERIRVYDYLTREAKTYHPNTDPELAAPATTKMLNHGGADYHLMKAFVAAVAAGDASLIRSGPRETLESHLITFAAERARVENRTVEASEIEGFRSAAAGGSK
jgi:predicted dehydrogenase